MAADVLSDYALFSYLFIICLSQFKNRIGPLWYLFYGNENI